MIQNCRVLKQSELDILKKALNSILLDWREAWLPNTFTASVTDVKALTAQDRNIKQSGAKYFAAWSHDSWCAVLSDLCDIELVAKALLGYRPENNIDSDMPLGPTMHGIVDDALLELIQRIVAGGNIAIDAVPVKLSKQIAVPAEAFRPWSGAIIVDLSIVGSVICLMLSGSVIENIIPRQVKDIPGISIEKSVVINGIKDKKIEVHVKLKQTNLSIGTLANLSPGDVIVLEHKVDCPFNLVIDSGNKHCTGYLGKRDGNYALKIDSLAQGTY